MINGILVSSTRSLPRPQRRLAPAQAAKYVTQEVTVSTWSLCALRREPDLDADVARSNADLGKGRVQHAQIGGRLTAPFEARWVGCAISRMVRDSVVPDREETYAADPPIDRIASRIVHA